VLGLDGERQWKDEQNKVDQLHREPPISGAASEKNLLVDWGTAEVAGRRRRKCRMSPLFSLKGKPGQVVLDQIRTVDKSRLVKRLGKLDETTRAHVLALLAELFAP
jgi:hypothetical protein